LRSRGMGLPALLLPVWQMPPVLPEPDCLGSRYIVFQQWFVGLGSLHAAAFAAHRALYPASAPVRGHMLAHLAGCFCAFSYLAINGWYAYLTVTFADPLDSTHAGACQLGLTMAAFQLYDLLCTLLVRALGQRSKGFELEMVVHHVVAGMLAYGGCMFNTLEHYGLLYFGVCETSSVFLVGVDAFRQFPELVPLYPALHELVRTLFGLSFLCLRVAYWPVATWAMEARLYTALLYEEHPAVTPWHKAFWVFVAVGQGGLTLMQQYWGSLILRALLTKKPPRKGMYREGRGCKDM